MYAFVVFLGLALGLTVVMQVIDELLPVKAPKALSRTISVAIAKTNDPAARQIRSHAGGSGDRRWSLMAAITRVLKNGETSWLSAVRASIEECPLAVVMNAELSGTSGLEFLQLFRRTPAGRSTPT